MDLTEEKLKEIISDIFKKPAKEPFQIYQGCKTHGAVFRSSNNLNICNDLECTSCREWDNVIKKELKNYFKNDIN
jgi:hypothetical protein